MTSDEISHITGILTNRENDKSNITKDSFFGFPLQPLLSAVHNLRDKKTPSIAYFSMEFGLAPSIYNAFKSKSASNECNLIKHHEVFSNMRAMDYYHVLPFEKLLDLPIYSGGLGVLAGDTLKSAADTGTSLVGIGILWNKGYFNQKFWFKYGQVPEETQWDPHTYPGLIPMDSYVNIDCGRENIKLKLWKYPVYSVNKNHVVPLILLDSNLPENSVKGKQITDQLYRSDDVWWKITQRMVLGMAGVKALNELGYSIDKYHMNEGHAAFAFIEKAKNASKESVNDLKKQFSYTCHTPVEAGHDRFNVSDLQRVMTDEEIKSAKTFGTDPGNPNCINLTRLAMNTSLHINAVAEKHGEITRLQFPGFKERIKTVTNGIHTFTWLSNSFAELFDKYSKSIGKWRENPQLLKNVRNLKNSVDFRRGVLMAHQKNKDLMAEYFKFWMFDKSVFTLSWARRIAPYKRPSLILQNPARLLEIAEKIGPIQIILAGKAHPNDKPAFKHLSDMMEKIDKLESHNRILKIAMLENYDTNVGKFLTNSVDLWLNNPLPPFEASGTSGMKAILNGVVQLSTLDGWVVEAADKSIGRIFGYSAPTGVIGDEENLRMKEDSEALYDSLEELVTLFYKKDEKEDLKSEWIDMMINCIVEAGFFNTQRMVEDYKSKIWEFGIFHSNSL